MSRRALLAVAGALGLAGAAVAHVAGSVTAAELALLAAGIVVGELLVLRLEDGSAVPLSFAVMIVLAASFEPNQYVITVLAAELTVFVLCAGARDRFTAEMLVARVAVAAATLGAYRGMQQLLDGRETVVATLTTLGAVALAQLAVDLVARAVLRLGHSWTPRGRLAWLAVASSGMLMAIGLRGVDGRGDVGIWGPLLFSTPLLAAWYAFERLDAATRAYRQTIESLAMAPEFGGLVIPGHAQRVASLVVRLGEELGLPRKEIEDLEMAALLHHLGQVTLDDPEVSGRPDPQEVAGVTGRMLREIRPLAAAGDIVSGEADEPRRRLSVQVLRVASDFDDLTASGGTSWLDAIEALRSAPGFAYERRVLAALERVVSRSAGP